MDNLDFDRRGQRVQRGNEERKKRERQKAEREARAQALSAQREAELEKRQRAARIERAAQEAKRLEAIEAERRRTGGIEYCELLAPVPTTTEGDRIRLPPTALQSLTDQGFFDLGPETNGAPRAATFELALIDSGSGAVLGCTHAGVSEFSADQGTVGLPPKTALSLVKARGVEVLRDRHSDGDSGTARARVQVQVKFVVLPSPPKSMARLQPRGGGFHRGAAAINVDMRALLLRTLSGGRHVALSIGDWLPVRHDGDSVVLVVRTLEPTTEEDGGGSAIKLLATDMEVDLLPCEEEEAAQVAQVAARAAIAAAVAANAAYRDAAKVVARAHATTMLARLPPDFEPTASAESTRGPAEAVSAEASARATDNAVSIVVRFPDGAQLGPRRFSSAAPLQQLFDYLESDPHFVERTGAQLAPICNQTSVAGGSGGQTGEGAASLSSTGVKYAYDYYLSSRYPRARYSRADAMPRTVAAPETETGLAASTLASTAFNSDCQLQLPTFAQTGLGPGRHALFVGVPASDSVDPASDTVDVGSEGGGGDEDRDLDVDIQAAGDKAATTADDASSTSQWSEAAKLHAYRLDRQLSAEQRATEQLSPTAKLREEAKALADAAQAVDRESRLLSAHTASGSQAKGQVGAAHEQQGEDGPLPPDEECDRETAAQRRARLEAQVQASTFSSDNRVTLFHTLHAGGMEPQRAARAAQRFGLQLRELASMGYDAARLVRAVELLERYQGRLDRVVNGLAEMEVDTSPQTKADAAATFLPQASSGSGALALPTTDSANLMDTSASEAPAPFNAATERTPEGLRQAVAEEFHKLVESGLERSAAAAQALVNVNRRFAEGHGQPSAAPPAPAMEPAAAPASLPEAPGRWPTEQEQLAAMGFCDKERNAELLDRYNGRVLRVVNVLAGGD